MILLPWAFACTPEPDAGGDGTLDWEPCGGRFECVSCHDPHPSNPNAKYLRVDTKSQSMDAFCGVCHSAKADAKLVAKKAAIFTSMDQRAGAPAAAPAPAAPAKK